MADQGKTADIGHGVTVDFDGHKYFLLELPNVFSMSADDIENAHSGIEERWKEYFAGLKDAGELQMTINWTGDHNPVVGGPNKLVTVNFPAPPGKSVGAKFNCQGYVKGYTGAGPIEDKRTAQVTFKFSGKPTFTASS